MPTDAELLARYVRAKDAAAFADLVTRYLPLVYAAARRRAGDPALADDICQAVFLVLAKKATSLHAEKPLADWLLTVTKYAAANAIKQRARRRRHEAAAAKPEAAMPPASTDASDWTPLLDAALDRLPAADRRAVVLRYYADADYPDVAAALGVSEAAARKRVTRAVERLRTLFARGGVTVPAAALAAGLPGVLAVAPPATLSASIASFGTASAAMPASVLLSKGTLHAMLMSKIKMAAAVALGVIALASTGVGLAVVFADAPSATAVFPVAAPAAGWLEYEFRGDPTGRAKVRYVEPSTGRTVTISPRGGPPDIVDPPSRTAAQYAADVHAYVVGPAGHSTNGVPVSAADLLDELDRPPGTAHATLRLADPATAERVADVTIDLARLPPDARARTPARFEFHFGPDGSLRRVTAFGQAGGAAYDAVVVTPVAGPPFTLEHLDAIPLPPGVTLVDNRPTPQVRAVLDRLDAIVENGLGVNAAVVHREADPHTGAFSDSLDEVTVCAGTAKRYVIATWALAGGGHFLGEPQAAPRPAGWPTPTFRQVIDAVGDTRPNQFFVFDGKQGWTGATNQTGRPGGDGTGRTTLKDPDAYWWRFSVAGQLWGVFGREPGVWTHFLLVPIPGDHRMTLTAQSSFPRTGPDGTATVQPMGSVKLLMAPDLGPLPVQIETVNFMIDPTGVRRGVTDIDSAAWMFHNPVRVPEHWRTLFLGDSNPPDVKYDTLVPAAGGDTLPAAWFGDPAAHWAR